MVKEQNTVDVTTNGGGESSTTGNTLVYDLPSNPTSTAVFGKVTKLIIDNATGSNGRILLGDLGVATTTMPAVAMRAIEMGANETFFANEEDLGNMWINAGIVAQASNGVTSNGYKITAEVEVF